MIADHGDDGVRSGGGRVAGERPLRARRPRETAPGNLSASYSAERWYLVLVVVNPARLESHPIPTEAMEGAVTKTIYRAMRADFDRCGAIDLYRVSQCLRAQGYADPHSPLLDALDWPLETPWPPIEAVRDHLLSQLARRQRRAELLAELEGLRDPQDARLPDDDWSDP